MNPALLLLFQLADAPPEALLAGGRTAEALAAVEQALASDRGNPGLRALKSRCLFQAGRYPECEALLQELVSGPPPPTPAERAKLLLRLGEARL
ncbi:MAG: tetratricopeptide repeat protein, partial [Thermoanaerobaculia bacterium]